MAQNQGWRLAPCSVFPAAGTRCGDSPWLGPQGVQRQAWVSLGNILIDYTLPLDAGKEAVSFHTPTSEEPMFSKALCRRPPFLQLVPSSLEPQFSSVWHFNNPCAIANRVISRKPEEEIQFFLPRVPSGSSPVRLLAFCDL